MNFISWAFVILLAGVLAARLTVGRRKTEWPMVGLVLAASVVFIVWHVPAYLLIILTSIGVDFVGARYIDRQPDGSPWRRALLVGSLAVNLGLLAFFKYTDFAISSAEWLVGAEPKSLGRLGLVLPMGISFYTFGSMSYTIDVYRRKLKPTRRFRDFFYFVTFFPHLVAGPIIRAEQFLYQMARTRRPRLAVFNEGAFLVIRGAFLKMVCADNIALVVNRHWTDGYAIAAGSTGPLLLAVLFAAQIFCDFEGYSSIARGLAYWMGYRFPLNFREPYIAGTFSNFWERWHITLSRWLRDYLYIPLGGNRLGRWRTYANLLTVMLLGGLWHGASMTFVVWGAIHGAALAVERLLGLHRLGQRPGARPLKVLWYLVVQAMVILAWVFFRSETLEGALKFVGNIASLDFVPPARSLFWALAFVAPVAFMHVHRFLLEHGKARPVRGVGKAMLAGSMAYLVLTCYGATSAFIYFQF